MRVTCFGDGRWLRAHIWRVQLTKVFYLLEVMLLRGYAQNLSFMNFRLGNPKWISIVCSLISNLPCQRPVDMGSQVPSPTDVNKSQLTWRQSPNFWASRANQSIASMKGILVTSCKNISGLVLRVGSSFLQDPALNTSHEPHLQKVLPCRHPCHT